MLSYTLELKRKIDNADGELIGVKLGKFCIDNNIPASKVAKTFSVSRMTVYQWFKGEVKPRPNKTLKIQEFIDTYTTQ